MQTKIAFVGFVAMARIGVACFIGTGIDATQIAAAFRPVGDNDAAGQLEGGLCSTGGDTRRRIALVALDRSEKRSRCSLLAAFFDQDFGVEVLFCRVVMGLAGNDTGLAARAAVEVDDHRPLWPGCGLADHGGERSGQGDSHAPLEKAPAQGLFRVIIIPAGGLAAVLSVCGHGIVVVKD